MRKYIGARYMPKFVGTYDVTTEYEALSVVDNGSGTSYVSNKPVPPGIPLTDNEYWTVYGTSSGAILNLQNQIDEMNDGSVSGSLQNQIDSVNAKFTRRYIFIGDSYGHASGSNDGWIDKLVTMLGLTSDMYWDSALGGSGFGEHTTSYYDLLTALVGTLTSEEKNSVTDLVVIGGANDMATDETTLAANINIFTTYARAQLPNVKIYIGMCSGNWLDDIIGIREPRTLQGYTSGRGYCYINNIEYLLHNRSLVGSDRVHPTTSGYEKIAEFIFSYLQGGTNKVTYREITTPTITDNTYDPVTMRFLCTIDNELATLSAGDSVIITPASAVPLSHGLSVNTKLSINSNLLKGLTPRGNTNYNGFLTSITYNIYSSIDNAWHDVIGSISIFDGIIWVSNNDVRYRAPGTLYDVSRSVTQIKLPVFQISGNTLYT